MEKQRNNNGVKTPCNSEELSISDLLINYIKLNRTNEQTPEDSRTNKKTWNGIVMKKEKFQIEKLEQSESCGGVLWKKGQKWRQTCTYFFDFFARPWAGQWIIYRRTNRRVIGAIGDLDADPENDTLFKLIFEFSWFRSKMTSYETSVWTEVKSPMKAPWNRRQ